MAEDLDSHFPIGISLGHKFLRSAYYDSNNELRVIASIPSGQEWQDYFVATMQSGRNHAPYDDPKNLELSAKAISSIVAATVGVLSKNDPDLDSLKIRSISVPQQFDDKSSMVNIMRIAQREGYIGKGNQVLSHFNSARLAYNLDNYIGYGFPEGTDVDDMENFVLVVDLGTTYLSLGFVITGTILFAPVGVQHWTDFEPDDFSGVGEDAGSLPPFTINKIQDFLAERLELLTGDVPDLPSHVVAVILTGEASSAGMEEMKSVLQLAIPAFSPRFKFVKDPALVGVEGAAHRARQAVTEPYFTEPDAPGDHEHLERAERPSVDGLHEEL